MKEYEEDLEERVVIASRQDMKHDLHFLATKIHSLLTPMKKGQTASLIIWSKMLKNEKVFTL